MSASSSTHPGEDRRTGLPGDTHGTGLPGEPSRGLVVTAFAGFLAIGWAAMLLPSLILDVQSAFAVNDIDVGGAYFVYFILYVVGTFSGGVLTERLGRRVVLPAAALLLGAGLLGCAAAPAWLVFVIAYLVVAVGAGGIDAGVNALVMDLYANRASGGALNRLHLFYSIGAFVSPLVIGRVAAAGVDWRANFVLAAIAPAVIAVLLVRARTMPHGRHDRGGAHATGAPGATFARGMLLPLVVLAVAIGTYVSSEGGVSSWLVRFLDAPTETATLGLSLFWGGLALGRFVSSLIADRMGAVRFAASWTFASGVLIILAVLVPDLAPRIALFAVAGFASGPAYPMIMSIAGRFYPGRTSMVSGILASAAVVGSVIYPPVMGVIFATLGPAVGMIGTGVFALVSAGAIILAGRLGNRLSGGRSLSAHAPHAKSGHSGSSAAS